MIDGLLLLLGAQALSTAVDAPLPEVPKPVADYLARRLECEHWMGEEPYDRKRRAEILRAQRSLRCSALKRDEAKLRSRYPNRPEITIALDKEPVL
jgi:hypothetical protein